MAKRCCITLRQCYIMVRQCSGPVLFFLFKITESTDCESPMLWMISSSIFFRLSHVVCRFCLFLQWKSDSKPCAFAIFCNCELSMPGRGTCCRNYAVKDHSTSWSEWIRAGDASHVAPPGVHLMRRYEESDTQIWTDGVGFGSQQARSQPRSLQSDVQQRHIWLLPQSAKLKHSELCIYFIYI